MRRSWFLGSAAVAVLALASPLSRVLAESTETVGVTADGSQLEAAGADSDPEASAKNLNTIPEDGSGSRRSAGADSPLVRRLIASRPNEDLVICVAGCFSGRDPVVYAQPAQKYLRKPVAAQTSLSGPMQNPGQKIAVDPKPGKAAAADVPLMPSEDPHAPKIINGAN
ncbi:hypothetical protein [Hyphomicrobium sp.]|uniref:hypothetical protein n=1 Tax=Hyphomicrobium sp. TaxID=82 RepID=UPI002D780A40|nr:hypothetical protein [Hyphomicrobium sp.]HET6390185.1 hypothetical protein [Hyphomicrobium sp.]